MTMPVQIKGTIKIEPIRYQKSGSAAIESIYTSGKIPGLTKGGVIHEKPYKDYRNPGGRRKKDYFILGENCTKTYGFVVYAYTKAEAIKRLKKCTKIDLTYRASTKTEIENYPKLS